MIHTPYMCVNPSIYVRQSLHICVFQSLHICASIPPYMSFESLAGRGIAGAKSF